MKTHIDDECEFYPVDEQLTGKSKMIGVSIPSKYATKDLVLKLVNDFKLINATVMELYNGNQLTPENVDSLF